MREDRIFSQFNRQYENDGLFHDTIETSPVMVRGADEGFTFANFNSAD